MKDTDFSYGADDLVVFALIRGALIRLGYDVRAFVYYNSFNSWGWLDHCPKDLRGSFEVFSWRCSRSIWRKTAMKNCNNVMHLASLIGIPYSYNSPQNYVDTNVKGTLNVLQAARLGSGTTYPYFHQ